MSGLSWAIYFAEVLEGLKAATLMATGAAFFVLGIAAIGWTMPTEKTAEAAAWVMKRAAAFVVLFGLIGIVMPSRQTVYLMVGVEAATRMAATSEAREILSLVRQRLVAELQPASK